MAGSSRWRLVGVDTSEESVECSFDFEVEHKKGTGRYT